MNRKFKIGDKVVPVGRSTAFNPMLSDAWVLAQSKGIPYLYVVGFKPIHISGVGDISVLPEDLVVGCAASPDCPYAYSDSFLESDLVLYAETPARPHTVLAEAENLIYGDREKDYGKVSDNFADIAKGWQVIVKTNITPEQVGLMMAWLKICRANKDNCEKRDSLVDLAGYAGCIDKIKQGL